MSAYEKYMYNSKFIWKHTNAKYVLRENYILGVSVILA